MTSWLSQFLQGLSQPFKWWVVVAPWEQGVRVRLGRTACLLKSGPHFRIPWLDRVYVQSVRTRALTESNITLTSRDGKTVVLSYCAAFYITDMLRLYQMLSNPETIISASVSGTVAEVIPNLNSSELSAAVVSDLVNKRFREKNWAGWGIGVPIFTITSFALVRTYRILSNDYRVGVGLWDLERENAGERR